MARGYATPDSNAFGAALRSREHQRNFRNLPVGAGEAVMLKNQRRHSTTVRTLSERVRAL